MPTSNPKFKIEKEMENKIKIRQEIKINRVHCLQL